MTKTNKTDKKIELSRSQDVPFDRLVLSKRNVRRLHAGLSIEELAEDIAQRTLLQSLSVRPIPERDGYYEVQAGGRRYRALALLVKQKRLAKTAPIPCIVRDAGILEEDSLAENVQRQNLHPLDQFRAFQTLREQGLGEEEIAARFFVTPQSVKQRLKLASVSPKLLEIYAADEMSLEQLMGFTVSDDHAKQEQVWETVSHGYNKSAITIRRLLTENTVEANDARVCFVGLPAYEAAGGNVIRDLFSEENDDCWIQDVALLERLFSEKLAREAETVKAEGWKWLQVAEDFPFGHAHGMRHLSGEVLPLSEEEENRRCALQSKLEEIEAKYQDEGVSEDIERRAVEIETALAELDERPVRYDPSEIARAGAFVSVDAEGRLVVERGFVRHEDEIHDSNAPEGNGGEQDRSRCVVISPDGSSEATAEDDGAKPLSERLVLELTAHRTLALRDALANDPDTAFLAALHAMTLQAFYRYETESCLEITVKNTTPFVQGPDLKSCASARAIEARHEEWAKKFPEDAKDLWERLRSFDVNSRMALFAHCTALTVNAVHGPNYVKGSKRHADQLAEDLALNMAVAGWKPTAANYLGRVSKARILEAVTETKGASAAELIEHMRKSDMAEQAERLLMDTGWLPEPLRTSGAASLAVTETPQKNVAASGDDLPAFLAEAA
jgi:ParB family chromosome partitioning protein